MRRISRAPQDETGVASTVGTILTFVVVLTFLSSISATYVPARMKDLEYVHMEAVRDSFLALQSALNEPWLPGDGLPLHLGRSVTVPLGSEGLPGFADPVEGILSVDAAAASVSFSYEFVTRFDNGTVEKVDQDVVLLLDSSGSMRWNDPDDLRLQGAADYINTLSQPDRVAIVDFDHRARLTRQNVGGEAHHLYRNGHAGDPDYADAVDDLDTIDSRGGTNFGWAMWVANNELIENGDEDHTWVEILLTDGWNNYWWYNWWAQSEAIRAKENGILLFTIGLGNHDQRLLRWMAEYTGGAYYAAPTAESLRWIYYDISQRFQGGVQCLCAEVEDAGVGRVSLEVPNRFYAPQTVSYEAGALFTTQSDGAVMTSPPALSVARAPSGGVHLGVTLTTLLGSAAERRGHGSEILNLEALATSSVRLPVTLVQLQSQVDTLEGLRAELDYWAREGAVTWTSASVLKLEIQGIEAWLAIAIDAEAAGDLDAAWSAVQDAMNETDDAIFALGIEAATRGIQNWLADSLTDSLIGVRCRLTQWGKWATGITLRIETSHLRAWGDWLNKTLDGAGARHSIAFDPRGLTVQIHGVDAIDLRTLAVDVNL